MRTLSEEIKKAIESLESFVYCFEISFVSKETLYLTSSSKAIEMNDRIFIPNSGLSMKSGIFNDSAQDHIILEGIFEDGGIDRYMDLTNGSVKILLYFLSGRFYNFITYICTTYTRYDLSFIIRLESEAIKYNQSLLLQFSKTCRAHFGDRQCNVDKTLYSGSYVVSRILGKVIIINNMNKEDGYFNFGDAIFAKHISMKILLHFGNHIELDKAVPDHDIHYKNVLLNVGCDKKFLTCCNKFNNAVNFRGEPLIPARNFLKIDHE
jgi:uncharacterized phage protein (TIGR02218 family)